MLDRRRRFAAHPDQTLLKIPLVSLDWNGQAPPSSRTCAVGIGTRADLLTLLKNTSNRPAERWSSPYATDDTDINADFIKVMKLKIISVLLATAVWERFYSPRLATLTSRLVHCVTWPAKQTAYPNKVALWQQVASTLRIACQRGKSGSNPCYPWPEIPFEKGPPQ